MEHANRSGLELAARRPAAETAQRRSAGALARDVRPRAVAQLELIQAMRAGPVAQREAAPEEEEPLQAKITPGVAQREAAPEEEELQMKTASPPAVAQLEEAATPASNQTGLPDGLKAGVESLSGMSLDGVRVHYNSAQPAQLNALAYAQGTDIHVAPGQERHLPHEAWHVVQQAQGRVEPTMQMKDGVPVNDDVGLESEADRMGQKALSLGA